MLVGLVGLTACATRDPGDSDTSPSMMSATLAGLAGAATAINNAKSRSVPSTPRPLPRSYIAPSAGVGSSSSAYPIRSAVPNASSTYQSPNASNLSPSTSPSAPPARWGDPASGSQRQSAPIIGPDCIQMRKTGSGITADNTTVTNGCAVPVKVLFCFPDRKNACDPTSPVGWGVTNTLPRGGKGLVVATGSLQSVRYYVCDMSDSSLPCLRPRP